MINPQTNQTTLWRLAKLIDPTTPKAEAPAALEAMVVTLVRQHAGAEAALRWVWDNVPLGGEARAVVAPHVSDEAPAVGTRTGYAPPDTADLLDFLLESVAAGGPDLIEDDRYEIVGEGNATWDVSLSHLCSQALDEIRRLRTLTEAAERLRQHCERLAVPGERCLDGGKCTHACRDRCWRRDNCATLTLADPVLVGVPWQWRDAAEMAATGAAQDRSTIEELGDKARAWRDQARDARWELGKLQDAAGVVVNRVRNMLVDYRSAIDMLEHPDEAADSRTIADSVDDAVNLLASATMIADAVNLSSPGPSTDA